MMWLGSYHTFIILLALTGLLTFSSCSENMTEEPDLSQYGYDFMPIEVGDEWLFDLDSIIYDPEPSGIVIDTLSYLLRFTVADTFVDGQGDKAFQIERYVQALSDSMWRLTDVWSAKVTRDQVIWREGNLPFISLVFPVYEGERWDGNALINDDDLTYKIRGETIDVFKFWNSYEITSIMSEEIAGVVYDSVATVLHVDREITIEKRLSMEKYAKGTGLVYKRMVILDTQNENVVVPFEDRAERGYIITLNRR